MKIKSLLLLFVFLVLLCGATPCKTMAQDCAGYYLLTNGAEYELVNYDRKDNLTGRVRYKVTSVNSSPSKTEATIQSKSYDDKGMQTTEGEYTVSCQNGSMLIDMKSMVSPELLSAHQHMDIKMRGDFLEYPFTLSAGQKLKDGMFTIEVLDKESGKKLSTIETHVTNRTVGEKESINVPAGSYSAYKISQEMETVVAGMNTPVAQVQTIEYFVPGVGVVRSEAYRNGKLLTYSVLRKVPELH